MAGRTGERLKTPSYICLCNLSDSEVKIVVSRACAQCAYRFFDSGCADTKCVKELCGVRGKSNSKLNVG